MKKKKRNNWPLIVTILAFTISLLFSFISESVMPKVGIIVGIMILILFIFIGIIFDMIGVAVTSSNEEPLHAMSSKKIKGAKKAVSFGVSVAKGLASTFNLNIFYTGLIVTALIAALTIGGKAFCKRIAIDNNHKIVYMTAKVISKFEKKKK